MNMSSVGFAPVRRDYFPGGDTLSSDPELEHEDAISGVCCLLSPLPMGGRIPAEGPYVAPGEAVELRRVLDAVPWRWRSEDGGRKAEAGALRDGADCKSAHRGMP